VLIATPQSGGRFAQTDLHARRGGIDDENRRAAFSLCQHQQRFGLAGIADPCLHAAEQIAVATASRVPHCVTYPIQHPAARWRQIRRGSRQDGHHFPFARAAYLMIVALTKLLCTASVTAVDMHSLAISSAAGCNSQIERPRLQVFGHGRRQKALRRRFLQQRCTAALPFHPYARPSPLPSRAKSGTIAKHDLSSEAKIHNRLLN
jgi:hypothetical protein